MDTSKFATKADVTNLRTELKSESKSIRGEILRVEEKMENIEEEIKELRSESTAEFKKLDNKLDKLLNTLDGFVGTVDDLRTDNTVGTHHTRELQINVDEHEKRLKQIESSKLIV